MLRLLRVLSTAREPLADLPDQFALWPCQPMIMNADGEQSLLSPTVLVDFLARSRLRQYNRIYPRISTV
jgi:hypothetical protein